MQLDMERNMLVLPRILALKDFFDAAAAGRHTHLNSHSRHDEFTVART